MKKTLFLVLLISSISYGQAIAPTRVKITSNVISTSAPFINAQETDGFVNKINKADLVDVLEFSSATPPPVIGTAGKIYVNTDNRKIYRWNGTFYSEMAITDISNKVDKVTGERLINAAEITKLANQSGTNTGDQDLSSYATNSNLALKANDNAVVHLTGEEIVTGPKTFDVSSNAYGVKVNNSLTGVGINSLNSSNGIGIRSANSSIGFGISSVNTSSGIGIGSYNSSTGKALVLNSSPAATGIPFSIQKNNADQLTINNNGEIKQFGSTSGDVTLKASSVAGVATILTLPATTGTVALLSDITGTNSSTNTGDETTATIQSKRPLKTIENQSLEGTGNIDLTKTDVGLSNIDNTTDLLKPISTATQTALNLKVNTSLVGANSGVASLDSSGKVPLSQINDALLGSVNYKGTYNASTNSPALPLASNKGFYYVVSTAGTQQGMNFVPGDWIISDGTAWGKVDNNNAVTSVNGLVGSVLLSTANITDTTNKRYQTDAQQANNDATSSVQTQLNGKANDNAVVHLAGPETITGVKTLSPSVSAVTALARGTILSPTLTATANNDVLVGLDIAPTFANGAFTGVQNIDLRLNNRLNFQSSNWTIGDNNSLIQHSGGLKISATLPGSHIIFRGAGFTSYMQMFNNNGSLLLQNGGTFTDDGINRLQVTGTASSGTTALNNTPPTANNQLTRKDYVDSAVALKENTENKQNSLVADGTNVKFPTVNAVRTHTTNVSNPHSVTATQVGAPSGSGTSTGTNTGDNATNTQYSGLQSNATHTGDATGSTVLTLATVNANVGTFGNASNVAQSTVNAKGLTTAIANVPIQIVQSQVTGLVADLAGKVGGTGTTNFLPKFAGTGTVGNSIISEVGGNINVSGSVKSNGLESTQDIISGYDSKKVRLVGITGGINFIQSYDSVGNTPYSLSISGFNGENIPNFNVNSSNTVFTGAVKINNLSGTGSRVVTSDAVGNLSSATNFTHTGAATFSSSVLSQSNGFLVNRTSSGTSATPFYDNLIKLNEPNFVSGIQIGNAFNSTTGTYLKFVVNSTAGTNTPIDALTLNPSGAATFSSTVTAPTFTGALNGNAATASSTNTWSTIYGRINEAAQGSQIGTLIGVHTNGDAYKFTPVAVQSFLGLGSNAYNSTAYLPLTGGTLTGGRPITFDVGNGAITIKANTGGWAIGNFIQGSAGAALGAFGAFGTSDALNYYFIGNYGSEAFKMTPAGAATFSGSVTATAFFQSSDRRLKTILKRDGDVAYFKWKDNRDTKTHIGYIAQEVKKEYPDQVQKDDKGMLSVNYIEVLVAKIQDLEKRIKQLEK